MTKPRATPPHIRINDKIVPLEDIGNSKGGQKRYKAWTHVPGLGTVYVTAYAGQTKDEPTTLDKIADALDQLNGRLDIIEDRLESPPTRPSDQDRIPPPPPSA